MAQPVHPFPVHLSLAASSLRMTPENAAEISTDMMRMFSGIRKYHFYTPAARKKEPPAVWRAGALSLKKFAAENEKKNGAVLLLPSPVNGAAIFDLCASRSLAAWLAGQGMDVYLLDWGDLCADEDARDFDGLLGVRLAAALDFLETEERSVHALGYCIGGNILLATAAMKQNLFRSLVFLATPWDFHAGKQLLTERVEFWGPKAMIFARQNGYVPASFMQALFATLDPDMAAKKFARFAALKKGSEEESMFMAVESWLNGGVDLPAAMMRTVFEEWFAQNKTARNEWTAGGQKILPAAIAVPSLVVAAQDDQIVNEASAKALYKALPDAALLQPRCGHVGLIAGKRSVEEVWRPAADFMRRCQRTGAGNKTPASP